jgi:MYXO-CTERM domain-containing protein
MAWSPSARFVSIATFGLVLLASTSSQAGTIHRGSVLGPRTVTNASARTSLVALAPETSSATLVAVETAPLADGSTVVRFEQTHLGLPVIGAGASVVIEANGSASLAVAATATGLPSSKTPVVDAIAAAIAARRYSKLPVSGSDAHLVFFAHRGETRLAWAVLPPIIPGIPTAPRVMVDALTGDVLEARDLVVFKNAAKVHPSNPVKSPSVVDVTLPVTSLDGSLENAFISSYNCIDQQKTHQVNLGGFPLTVHTCELVRKATPDGNGDYLYPVGGDTDRDDAFSEVAMFHHANRAYDYFRALRNDATAQVVVDKPLRTISNLQLPTGLTKGDLTSASDPSKPLDPLQNAFFSPAGGQLGAIFQALYGFNAGAMWFGQGPKKDYSYDGDVVYHEFTHGVVDATLQLGSLHLDKYGVIDSPGAMNEGLADYFSSAIAGDPDVGEYASKDVAAQLTSLRTLDNKDTCLGTIVGEVHYDSTFFSGGLWSARQSLPQGDRQKFDAAIYKAMLANAKDGDLGFEDAVNLFLAVLDKDLPAGGAALRSEMKDKRGILPECNRIFDWKGKAITAPTGLGSPGAFDAQGNNVFGSSVTIAPGMLQVHLDLTTTPATAGHVKFTGSAAASGGLGGIGGGGTKFTPVVLVKFGQPLTWTTTGKLAHDADVTVDAKGSGGDDPQTYTADFEVPDGVTGVWLQIANKGDNGGSYDGIELSIDAKTPPPTPTPTPTASEESGCSCRAAGTSSNGGALALAGFVGLGLVAMRRRKR